MKVRVIAVLFALAVAGLSPATPQAAAQGKSAIRQSRKAPGPRAKRARPGNPSRMMLRLMEMEPERRREFMDEDPAFNRLPENQRNRLEQSLQRFDRMPERQREMLRQRYQLFAGLPPERQADARRLYREWQGFPGPRRQLIGRALARLRGLSAADRKAMLASDRFAERFSGDERRLITDLLALSDERD